jgi:hypothetical protein
MDQDTLVDNGSEGLNQIAQAFRTKGIAVSGVYLIKLTSHDGFEEWIIRLIVETVWPDLKRKMISELVRLRRDNMLPRTLEGVRFDIVSAADAEASRVIEYVRLLGGPPVVIRDTVWKGLFIEYALVASIPARQTSTVNA